MQVRLLGTVGISVDRIDLELGPPRQRALFAVLAARAKQVVSREDLIDAVWGARPPATVESSVYTYVARLRRLLEPRRAYRAPSSLLVLVDSGYSLQLDPSQVDVHAFTTRLERARHLHGAAALGALDSALALWRGTAFGGAVGPFADAERTRLSELQFTAMEERAATLIDLGRHVEAIGELTELVRRNPLRERLRYLRMVAYYRSGRRVDALADFRDVRRLLIGELGIEPSDDLQRCHQQILRSDPGLRSAGPPAPHAEPATDLTADAPPAQLPLNVPRFTGRRAELEQLHRLITEAATLHETAVLLVNGGPGVGKTALAVRFAHELSHRFPDGQLFLDLGGFADAAQPVSSIDALNHLVCALGGTPLADLERQAGVFRTLVSGKRLLIVLDNAAAAQQVRPLLPGARSCVVIVTSRNRLSGLVARDGAHRLTLNGMPADDAVALMKRIVGPSTGNRELTGIEEAARACCGLPAALRIAAERIVSSSGAAVADTIQELVDGGKLLDRLDAEGDAPSSIRALFSWSYRALPEEAAEMFRALGVHPAAEFSHAVAAAIAGANTELARRALHTLVSAHLVEEAGPDRYRCNDLMHAYATERAAIELSISCRHIKVHRMLSFYGHAAGNAIAMFAAGRRGAALPSATSTLPPGVTTAEQAGRWLETELSNLVAAADLGADIGAQDLSRQLYLVIQEFLSARSTAGADQARR